MRDYPLNIVERLKSGNFHISKDAGQDRTEFYKKMKPYIESGEIHREIQGAPRCKRYKIHYYYSATSLLIDTICIDNSTTFCAICEIMEFYNLPLDFKFENSTFGDFKINKDKGYWRLEYKGEIDKLCFTGYKWNGEITDSKMFPSGVSEQSFNDFSDLVYQVYNYMVKFNLIKG